MDLSFILFSVFAFLAVVLTLEGAYNVWSSKRGAQAKRIAQRLAAVQGLAPTEASVATLERAADRERFPALTALLARSAVGRQLNEWVRSSGMATTAGEVLLLSVGLFVLGMVLPSLIGRPPILGPAIGLGLAVLPWWRVSSRRAKLVARFEAQFPEALDLMGRAMRAGHAFPTAVKMVGDEMSEPLGPEFRILFDETNYGVPAAEALSRLAARVPLADVSFFVVAVMIQRESGGNLAELLDKISAIVRERLKLMGEVRTLSAEGKLSAWILTALPFAVGVVVNIVNPEFMAVLWTDPMGLRMVGLALFMMILGIVWMRRIIRIRV